MKPIPIIVCGKSAHVAVGVKEGIRPTYEALHIIQSLEAGMRDIPSLLEGLDPPSKEWANLGTQEYGKKVAAVVVGGGYNDADFEQLRNTGEGKSSIPWLRHDISKEIDPRQPRPKAGIEYGEQLAKKIVKCLQDLEEDKKMGKDGVYWF
ncbi:hypothetical protein LT330_007427 [Penicillium expansum]|uniref:Uncharacterized protein n=1 Tax=Penicillium expansum TaxID=27334 RepID=A0A0A2L3D9_PENEN|nr:hypothetical protein PEX2_044750 [Penicillium expansum]KAJ5518852.1 hypothetical protein N7453_001274 [Penicillium expansum]KAK4868229.1 hypothetical protein LT330_007427 [Penicillium expansum]KGO62952.1 hypothetical protein PEX2_044750 [Penicillium expansum]KGO71115.1 hypothetical protein PEX1_091730 [Penicillium expansum]